jgi:heptosyltransferase-3
VTTTDEHEVTTGAPPERVVFVRPGALGDTLLAFPALALARRAWPDAQITLIARGDVLPLAGSLRLTDFTYAYDLPAWSTLFAPGPVTVDPLAREVMLDAWLVVWAPDPESVVERNARALGAGRVLIAPGRPVVGERRHMALLLARALAPWGIAPPASLDVLRAELPPLRMRQEHERMGRDAIAMLGLSHRERLVALHAGSGGRAKQWPPDRFAAVANAIRARQCVPLLIEGPQDAEVVSAVVGAITDLTVPVLRHRSISTLAAALRLCAGYVGNDSGVTHLAGLLGVPTVALFGPTDPAVWAPVGRQVRVVRAPDGDMARLGVGKVVAALRDLMGSE